MASFPPIPTTPLAVEVRPNHWRKLGLKDFSRGLEVDAGSHFPYRQWSAIDERGEAEARSALDCAEVIWHPWEAEN